MRTRILISAFLACTFSSTFLMAEDLQNTVLHVQQSATEATNAVSSAVNTLTPVKAAPAKAAPSSASVAPPIAMTPPPLSSAPIAPTNSIAAHNAPASSLPLPGVDAQGKTDLSSTPSLLVPPTPKHDPAMLPSPNNTANNPPPALPNSLAPKPAAEVVVTPTTAPATPAVSASELSMFPKPPQEAPHKQAQTEDMANKPAAKKHYTNQKRVAYSKIRLPETIYNNHYDRKNKHLPEAYYESQYDALLFIAIARDDVNGVRSMLGYAKRDLNKPNIHGDTPLIAAAKNGAINSVRILLGKHADATAKDANGLTALQNAEQLGYRTIARVLHTMTDGNEIASSSEHYANPSSPLRLVSPDSDGVN